MNVFDTDLWDRDDFNQDYSYEESSADSTPTSYREQEESVSEDSLIENLLDDEEVSVVDAARIRLEQGRLYEMLIKHNLFESVDAMPQAVAKVQSEIKEFIIERLEVLLGMKSENKIKETHIVKESQFNDVEVQALKMIASKVTKGASDKVEEKTENSPKRSSPINAINSSNNKKSNLNSIKNTVVEKTKSVSNNIPVKSSKQVPTNAINKENIEKNVSSKNLSVDDIAKKDMKYIESLKQMTLAEANSIVSQRHSKPKPNVTLNQEDINRQYTSRMAVNEKAQAFSTLLAAATKVK